MQEHDGLQQFEDSTTYEIQTLNEAVENLRPSTHTHNNLDVLNALTTALLADLQGLQQFEDATNYDIHDIREALLPISSAAHTHNNKDVLDTITEQYMRDEAAFHAQTADALHGLSSGLSEVSALAHSHSNKASIDALHDYGEKVYTFYNDGYRSLAGFTESYEHFCCEENGYAIYYNQPDFNWGAVIYTMCVEPVHISSNRKIMLSYKSGATDIGEM